MTALTARHPNYYVLDGCLGSLFKDNKNPGNSTVTRVLGCLVALLDTNRRLGQRQKVAARWVQK